MKTFLIVMSALVLSWCPATRALTTINPVNKFSFGANIGWMNWRPDMANGAAIGEFFCSGYIYAANVGWIHLGDGTPGNGMRYQNNSAGDYGVNHDGAGNLRGYAYGANIGWLTFTNRDANGATYDGPTVDLLTGRLSGFIWSANCGWISLSNAQAFVQTDAIDGGPDTDADGIPDAWELQFSSSLATLSGGDDSDGDGLTNAEEFTADTNPLDPVSNLQIVSFSAAPGGSPASVTWTSSPTRQYRIRASTDVAVPAPWAEVGFGLIPPDVGSTTTRSVTDASAQRFFVIEAVKPLSP